MAYDVLVNKMSVGRFATQAEALARVREELRLRPDCESEIRDSATGRAVAPAASDGWREQLARQIGY